MNQSIHTEKIDITESGLRVRTMTEDDLPRMLKWLTDSRVLAFYGGRDLRYDMESLRAHYTEPWDTVAYRVIMEYQGKAVGYGQIYLLSEEMYEEYRYPRRGETVFAADQFIGEPEYWSRGIGTQYMRMVLAFLRRSHQADAVILDPHQDNPRAVRAYEKAGFRVIARLPRHELFEGEKADCWLMEYRYPAGQ